MLTAKEKEGFREILRNLSEDDLVALKDTVTNRLIAARNKQGKFPNLSFITLDGNGSVVQRFCSPKIWFSNL